jgi:hypothetical protein
MRLPILEFEGGPQTLSVGLALGMGVLGLLMPDEVPMMAMRPAPVADALDLALEIVRLQHLLASGCCGNRGV